MGNCTSKSNPSEKNSKSEIPDFIYLNRSKGKLLLIKSKKIQKLILPESLFYSKDSAISLLSKQRLILIGGTSDRSLVSTCSILSLQTKEVQEMSEVPLKCKGGQIHEIGEWIYYIGGQTLEDNQLVQSSILRLSQKQNIWQEIKEPQRSSSTFKFSSLMNFGSCVMDKKIFIFGGQRFNKLGNLKASSLILSLTVDQGFILKTEAQMPFKVCNPLIAAGEKHAIVVGGTDPKTGNHSKACFYVVLKENLLKANLIDPLNMEFLERYPPFYTEDYSVFVSYPNIAVRYKDKNYWKTFHIKSKKSHARKRPRIDLRVSIEPVQVDFEEKKEDIQEEKEFQINDKQDSFETNSVKHPKSSSLKSSKSSKVSKSSSKVSKSSSKVSKSSSKVSKSSSNNSKSSSSNKKLSEDYTNRNDIHEALLEKSSHSDISLNLSISTANKALSMQSGLSISHSSSAFPLIPEVENSVDRLLKKTKTPDLKLIQTGENLAHKITIVNKNEGSQSTRSNNRKIVIIELKDKASLMDESSSSNSHNSKQSHSFSSQKSSSKLSESSVSSSEKQENVAAFLNLDSQDSSRRGSREKKEKTEKFLNPSTGSVQVSVTSIEDQMKAYKESVSQNMKYRPTSPAVPINSVGIDLKLPVISTPKSSVIRSDSASLLEEYKTLDGHERSHHSNSVCLYEPSPHHPSTDRPADLFRPNNRFIVKNVIRSEKNSIRLTPKSNTVKLKESSSSSSSDDSGPETPTKVTGLYEMTQNHPQILSPVPEFQVEDSICLHEHKDKENLQKDLKYDQNDYSEDGLVIESDSFGSADSSSSDDSSSKSSNSSSKSSNSSNSSSSSESFNKKRQENKAKRLKSSVKSVDSSDVSDTENDEIVLFDFSQGQKFLQLVSKSLKINPFFSVPSSLHLSDMQKYLRTFIPNREYVLNDELFVVLHEIHMTVNKLPLKEKEKWNIVMASKLLPEIQEISAEQLAFALGRAFKYVLMRKV